MNEVNADIIRTPEGDGDIDAFWDPFDWNELTPAEQAAWAVLGWNASSWDDETNIPASDEADWDDLTAEEQAAATALGYDQPTWDTTLPEE